MKNFKSDHCNRRSFCNYFHLSNFYVNPYKQIFYKTPMLTGHEWQTWSLKQCHHSRKTYLPSKYDLVSLGCFCLDNWCIQTEKWSINVHLSTYSPLAYHLLFCPEGIHWKHIKSNSKWEIFDIHKNEWTEKNPDIKLFKFRD